MLTYKLSAYEGPLDLLYSLIQTHKIDICDIPIASLTDQYLDFLEKAEDRDMDSMSEFALMAATLLEIKSRMLLPKPIALEEDDPRQALMDRLLEYKKVKLAADLFMSLDSGYEDMYYKAPESELIASLVPKPAIDDVLAGVTLSSLYDVFVSVLGKKELKVDKIRSSFKSVSKDIFTIKEKCEYMLKLLSIKHKISFRSLLEDCVSKMEMVVTFLAMLELMKEKEIKVVQKNIFDEITVWKPKTEM